MDTGRGEAIVGGGGRGGKSEALDLLGLLLSRMFEIWSFLIGQRIKVELCGPSQLTHLNLLGVLHSLKW